jgi:hypothetical protein
VGVGALALFVFRLFVGRREEAPVKAGSTVPAQTAE